MDVDDLQIVSSLTQDAVFSVADISWQPKSRRFVLLVNRYRWENEAQGNATPERVRAMLVVDNVLTVASMGVTRSDKDLVLSLLELGFEPGEDGQGALTLTLAGDGAIRLDVEALDVSLRDVTRPYVAPSGKTPSHDL